MSPMCQVWTRRVCRSMNWRSLDWSIHMSSWLSRCLLKNTKLLRKRNMLKCSALWCRVHSLAAAFHCFQLLLESPTFSSDFGSPVQGSSKQFGVWSARSLSGTCDHRAQHIFYSFARECRMMFFAKMRGIRFWRKCPEHVFTKQYQGTQKWYDIAGNLFSDYLHSCFFAGAW